MTGRISVILTVIAAALALAVAAVAFSSLRTPGSPRGPVLQAVGQHLRLWQSGANKALIKLPNAKPGQVAKGTTRLSVTGSKANLAVGIKNLRDVTGPNGGRLAASRRLWIDIRCAAGLCPGSRVVYRGPMSRMGTRSMGTWAPGRARIYAVRVWLVRGGRPPTAITGDNRFQGSRTTFGLLWTATAA